MHPYQTNSMGKILGLLIGWVLGIKFGILGLIAGIYLGSKLDEAISLQKKSKRVRKRPLWNKQIVELTYQTMGHLAKFDGKVSEKSIEIVTKSMVRFKLNKNQIKQAKKAFTQGKNEDFNVFFIMQKLQIALLMQPSMKNAIAGIFVELVEHTETASIAKLTRLENILKALGIIRYHSQHQRSHSQQGYNAHNQHSLQWAYQVLGVSPNTAQNDVKRKYRKLLSDHHPDRLHTKAKNPTEAEIKQANDKTHQIKKAYTIIKEHLTEKQI